MPQAKKIWSKPKAKPKLIPKLAFSSTKTRTPMPSFPGEGVFLIDNDRASNVDYCDSDQSDVSSSDKIVKKPAVKGKGKTAGKVTPKPKATGNPKAMPKTSESPVKKPKTVHRASGNANKSVGNINNKDEEAEKEKEEAMEDIEPVVRADNAKENLPIEPTLMVTIKVPPIKKIYNPLVFKKAVVQDIQPAEAPTIKKISIPLVAKQVVVPDTEMTVEAPTKMPKMQLFQTQTKTPTKTSTENQPQTTIQVRAKAGHQAVAKAVSQESQAQSQAKKQVGQVNVQQSKNNLSATPADKTASTTPGKTTGNSAICTTDNKVFATAATKNGNASPNTAVNSSDKSAATAATKAVGVVGSTTINKAATTVATAVNKAVRNTVMNAAATTVSTSVPMTATGSVSIENNPDREPAMVIIDEQGDLHLIIKVNGRVCYAFRVNSQTLLRSSGGHWDKLSNARRQDVVTGVQPQLRHQPMQQPQPHSQQLFQQEFHQLQQQVQQQQKQLKQEKQRVHKYREQARRAMEANKNISSSRATEATTSSPPQVPLPAPPKTATLRSIAPSSAQTEPPRTGVSTGRAGLSASVAAPMSKAPIINVGSTPTFRLGSTGHIQGNNGTNTGTGKNSTQSWILGMTGNGDGANSGANMGADMSATTNTNTGPTTGAGRSNNVGPTNNAASALTPGVGLGIFQDGLPQVQPMDRTQVQAQPQVLLQPQPAQQQSHTTTATVPQHTAPSTAGNSSCEDCCPPGLSSGPSFGPSSGPSGPSGSSGQSTGQSTRQSPSRQFPWPSPMFQNSHPPVQNQHQLQGLHEPISPAANAPMGPFILDMTYSRAHIAQLSTLLYMAHGHLDKMPTHLTTSELCSVLVLANEFDMVSILRSHIQTWLKQFLDNEKNNSNNKAQGQVSEISSNGVERGLFTKMRIYWEVGMQDQFQDILRQIVWHTELYFHLDRDQKLVTRQQQQDSTVPTLWPLESFEIVNVAGLWWAIGEIRTRTLGRMLDMLRTRISLLLYSHSHIMVERPSVSGDNDTAAATSAATNSKKRRRDNDDLPVGAEADSTPPIRTHSCTATYKTDNCDAFHYGFLMQGLVRYGFPLHRLPEACNLGWSPCMLYRVLEGVHASINERMQKSANPNRKHVPKCNPLTEVLLQMKADLRDNVNSVPLTPVMVAQMRAKRDKLNAYADNDLRGHKGL